MATLDYYNQNAAEFAAWTENVHFRKLQDKFLVLLPAGAKILDFGCGSGRDAKYFLKNGFDVTATDGSPEICRIASDNIGKPVKYLLFSDLDDVDTYDAIWACASILHLPTDELIDVLHRMARAIRPEGLIYTSFKYGTAEEERGGRFYNDMTVGKFRRLIAQVPELAIREQWTTADARPERHTELWLNLFLEHSNV